MPTFRFRSSNRLMPKNIFASPAFVFCTIVISLLVLVIFVATMMNSTSLDRVAILSYKTSGENVTVTNFDFAHDEITTYSFPNDTVVDVSRGLGEWKIQTITKLAVIEKINQGQLLQESITKHFRMPINYWYDGDLQSITEGSFLKKISLLLPTQKSNIPYKERLILTFYLFDNKTSSHLSLDETTYLKKISLKDGSTGFVRVEPAPQRVLAAFSDAKIVEKKMKLIIKDGTGTYRRAKEISEVLEVTGFIIVAIDEIDEWQGSCIITARNPSEFEASLSFYGCSFEKRSDIPDAEVHMKLGREFVF